MDNRGAFRVTFISKSASLLISGLVHPRFPDPLILSAILFELSGVDCSLRLLVLTFFIDYLLGFSAFLITALIFVRCSVSTKEN